MSARHFTKFLGWATSFYLCLSIGCSKQQPSIGAAEQALLSHFNKLQSTNDIDALLADYGERFFEVTPKAQWRTNLAKIYSKLGSFKAYQITGVKMATVVGDGMDGTKIALRCKVDYSNFPAVETFTLASTGSSPEFKIVGHDIKSPALSKGL